MGALPPSSPAGLRAGLVVGAYHYVATEPVIEHAIDLEEVAHAGGEHETPVVSRDVQRGGLLVGWALYGIFVGLIFGAGYALVQPRFGNAGLARNVFLAAIAAGWLVGVFPFLKYPANPPGVGDPETITYRQTLFLLFWVLSVGGALVAGWVLRLVRARTRSAEAWVATLVVYVLYATLLLALMPPNPDPV